MSKLVSVTQEHIDRAAIEDRCPIELALDDITEPGYWSCAGGVAWPHHGTYRWVIMSERCRRFMSAFDAGKPVQPFRFLWP